MDRQNDKLETQSWFITTRRQAFEGELRVAIVRIGLIVVFYVLHLIHHIRWAAGSESELIFHRQVTWLAAGGMCVSLAVLIALGQRFYPPLLKFMTTIFDLSLVTVAAALSSGPASPIVSCYYVIIALSALRFSLPLVWMSTLGAMAGYEMLVGLVDDSWFNESHATAPILQLMTLASLAATGIAVGQLVRMTRVAAEQFMFRHAHLERLRHENEEPSQ